MFVTQGKFDMPKRFVILVGIILSAISLCASTSLIQHHWQVRQTSSLCDLPTDIKTLSTTAKTLMQCLAYTQPKFVESGFVTFNSASGLCTVPDPTSMPSTFGQMYESDLAPTTEPCNSSSWTKTFKTQSVGNVVFGTESSLFDYMIKGADIKIQLGENIFVESYFLRFTHKGLCAFIPIVISKSSWNALHSNIFWEMTSVCTNGLVSVARQSLGIDNLISSGHEEMEVTWYTRNLPEDPNHVNPIYKHKKDGSKTEGSKESLLTAVKRGKGIKISTSLTWVSYHQRLEIDGCNVIGLLMLNNGVDAPTATFKLPLYWSNYVRSSSGAVKSTSWFVGKHTFNGDSTGNTPMSWFVDTCWSFAFMHSATGSKVSGSFNSLKSHILAGRRVRVLFESYSMEADNIFISNTQLITAQFLNQIDTPEPMVFSNGHWKWVRISTDGSFLTDIYEMGSSTKVSHSIMSTTASWFVQTREWIQMLVTSSDGTAVEGTKTNLVNAIRQGSSLRCVVLFKTNDILVFTADNIEIHNDENVAALLFRYIQFGDGIPYWRITLVCTTGTLQESRWTVGEHVKRGEKQYEVTTHWFVDI